MSGIWYSKNFATNTIELYFEKIPSVSIRSKLKSKSWKWNPNKKCWYTRINKESEKFTRELNATCNNITIKVDSPKSESVAVKDFRKDLEEIGCFETHPDKIDEFLRNLDGAVPTAVPINSKEVPQDKCIAVMAQSFGGNFYTIGIVKDVEFQNTCENIYWIDRKLSNHLLHGIINNKPYFIFKNELCRITHYSDSLFMKEIRKHSDYFSNATIIPEIWIYSLKMPCYNHAMDVDTVTAYVKSESADCLCRINVYYCPRCKKYYINSEQYNSFAEKYGLPYFRLVAERGNGDMNFSEWREESILHFMGYNVGSEDNLTTEERKSKLVHAIKTNTLTKAQIISFLEFLINRNENNPRFDNACYKWCKDVEFVRNYNIDEQRTIFARFKTLK